jgi:Leucine-rich repeat (LRR) protein
VITSFLLPETVVAQETNRIKVNNIDTAYQAYLKKIREVALTKRAELFRSWEEADRDTLYRINLDGLYLESLPDLSGFVNLKDLSAQNNQIEKAGRKSFISDSLTRINLSGNNIKKVKFKSSAKVHTVVLNENELKRIPRSIRKLKGLRTLEVNTNRIKRIPRFIRKLEQLEELNLNFNQLVLDEKAIRRLSHINTLLLAGNGITRLPENINELERAKKLNFSKNSLSDLPDSFGQLHNLTNLIFYQNEFKEIPDELFELKNLVEMDFYYNEITEIPDQIGNLINLQQLFLSFNQIAKIPDIMANLKSIKYLYIHHNQLIAIPDWITSYDKLERLDISYNKLLHIPDFSKMKSLAELDIQENELAYFPWELIKMKGLKSLIVMGNPFILTEEEKNLIENWNDNQPPGSLILIY